MSERIKFYMDEHVHPAITRALRLRGIDVLTAQDVRHLAFPDDEHLHFATQEQRVLFTNDQDFLRLNAQEINHAGIVFASQRTNIGQIVQGLVLVYEVLTPQEIVNRVEFL